MRLFAASLATETNTFSPIPTSRSSFEDFFYAPAGAHPEVPKLCSAPVLVARRRAARDGFTLIEGSSFWAEPSGTVDRASFESMHGGACRCRRRSDRHRRYCDLEPHAGLRSRTRHAFGCVADGPSASRPEVSAAFHGCVWPACGQDHSGADRRVLSKRCARSHLCQCRATTPAARRQRRGAIVDLITPLRQRPSG